MRKLARIIPGSCLVVLAFAGSVRAELVTLSIQFEYINFSQSAVFDPVAGSLELTVDNSVSVAGQAVDSISFSDPTGIFPTSNVLFDYRQGPDTEVPSNDHEFDIYFTELAVTNSHDFDFLLRTGGVGELAPGSSFQTGQGGLPAFASLFMYGGSQVGDFPVSQEDFLIVNITQAIPEPGSFVLVLSMAPFGVMGYRRRGGRRRCMDQVTG